ncbi:MarR family winged helix-turn-helix transcriptional regulator [Demequina pelophila]|uniref:MarR family winged helix-turn-helix transcriptional regulator n=1 Tax=Demequina pelophila TaxID=1638984 RepID=UPI000786740E|nr:MarR family transcriptional regulator [Demequina pelophila]
MDAVAFAVGQWRAEAPTLDHAPTLIFGRLARYAQMLAVMNDRVLAELGLAAWELDVLDTLTRQGAPYSLTAGDLERAMLITSGTTTHRIGRLEARGYVTRSRDADDRRVVNVVLTDAGRAACVTALEALLERQRRALDALETHEQDALTTGLRALGRVLRDAPPDA